MAKSWTDYLDEKEFEYEETDSHYQLKGHQAPYMFSMTENFFICSDLEMYWDLDYILQSYL